MKTMSKREGRPAAALLLCLMVLAAGTAAADDGEERWTLTLSGHHSYFFGEGGFGGGIRVPWEVVIEFGISAGHYRLGSGRARWLDKVEPLSGPAGWFDCRLVDGTYLDSSLTLHETPRVRFAAFPVAGEVRDGRIALHPGYRPPGNYLAITYECETDPSVAENWLARAELGKQILGKRQDAEKRRDGARQVVRVREVATLPPESSIDLPLQDGWALTLGAPDGARSTFMELRRLH